jgi:hypothetical protein
MFSSVLQEIADTVLHFSGNSFIPNPPKLSSLRIFISTRLMLYSQASEQALSNPPYWALGYNQPLTEIITRSRKIMFLGSKLVAGS